MRGAANLRRSTNDNSVLTISYRENKSNIIRIVNKLELNELLIDILSKDVNKDNYYEFYREIAEFEIIYKGKTNKYYNQKEIYTLNHILNYHTECLLYFRLGQVFSYQFSDFYYNNDNTILKYEIIINSMFDDIRNTYTEIDDNFTRAFINRIKLELQHYYTKMGISPCDPLTYMLENKHTSIIKKRMLYWIYGTMMHKTEINEIVKIFKFDMNWNKRNRYDNGHYEN